MDFLDDIDKNNSNETFFEDIELRKQFSRREFTTLDETLTKMVVDIKTFIKKHDQDHKYEDEDCDIEKQSASIQEIYDQSGNTFYGLKQYDQFRIINKALKTLKEKESQFDQTQVVGILDSFLEHLTKAEMQIKELHVVKQNGLHNFLKVTKEKLTSHLNAIKNKSSNKPHELIKPINDHVRKKNADLNLQANLNSPLLNNKMIEFESYLINSNSNHKYDKKGESLKLVNYKNEILKKLNKGMKAFNKKFEQADFKNSEIKRKNIRRNSLFNQKSSIRPDAMKVKGEDELKFKKTVSLSSKQSPSPEKQFLTDKQTRKIQKNYQLKEIDPAQESILFDQQRGLNLEISDKLGSLRKCQRKFEKIKQINTQIKDDLFQKRRKHNKNDIVNKTL